MWITHATNCDNKVTNMFTFVAVDALRCWQAVFCQKASVKNVLYISPGSKWLLIVDGATRRINIWVYDSHKMSN